MEKYIVNPVMRTLLRVGLEHAERCHYVKNLIADPRVRVKVRRHWRAGRATLLADYVDAGRRNWSNEPSWGMSRSPRPTSACWPT